MMTRLYLNGIKDNIEEPLSWIRWIYTAPGYSHYHAFSAEVHEDIDDYQDSFAYPSTMVTDDEQSESDDEDIDDELMTDDNIGRQDPLTMDFRMDGPKDASSPMVIINEEDMMPQDASALFLHWHH
jgi:hypothetical protein